MEYNELFGKRLTEELKYCKINQKNIAKFLNISEGNISNWKKGTNLPSIEMLYKLCVLLDLNANYLIGLEDETGAKISKNVVNSFNNNSGNINFRQ